MKKIVTTAMFIAVLLSATGAQAQTAGSQPERIETIKVGSHKWTKFSLGKDATKTFVTELKKGEYVEIIVGDEPKPAPKNPDGTPKYTQDADSAQTSYAGADKAAAARAEAAAAEAGKTKVEWEISQDAKKLTAGNNVKSHGAAVSASGDHLIVLKCILDGGCSYSLYVAVHKEEPAKQPSPNAAPEFP